MLDKCSTPAARRRRPEEVRAWRRAGRELRVVLLIEQVLCPQRQRPVFRHVDANTQKTIVTRRFEIKNDQASLGKMMKNVFAFLILGKDLKSDLNSSNLRQGRGGGGPEVRLWQVAE